MCRRPPEKAEKLDDFPLLPFLPNDEESKALRTGREATATPKVNSTMIQVVRGLYPSVLSC